MTFTAVVGVWLHTSVMSEPFIGSDAIAAGDIAKSSLRRRYTRLFPDVYVVAGAEPTAQDLARGGWLWSGRKAVVALDVRRRRSLVRSGSTTLCPSI